MDHVSADQRIDFNLYIPNTACYIMDDLHPPAREHPLFALKSEVKERQEVKKDGNSRVARLNTCINLPLALTK